jgi:dienelactone hydrolase
MLPMNVQPNRVQAKILICHGGADPFVKKGEIEDYLAAMERYGFDYQFVIYGVARHSFTNPAADQGGMDSLEYSESADRRSWDDMRQFFHEIF